MPRVSVILPNYNYARYLKERVRSILGQVHTDLELIYVDDGSSDCSNDFMQEFSSDPRVRLQLHSENSGRVYRRWNEGAQLAKGEWLWFAGADDSARPDFLSTMLSLADSYSSAALLYCRQETMDAHGRLMSAYLPGPAAEAEPTLWAGHDIVLTLMRNNFLSSASSMLIRRDAFEAVGGFDERLRLAADWNLYLSVLQAHDIAIAHRPLVAYRYHRQTVTNTTRTAVTLMENAYCVASAAAWIQRHERCAKPVRRTSLRMARARIFDLFGDPDLTIPATLRFAAEAVHEVVPDERLLRRLERVS